MFDRTRLGFDRRGEPEVSEPPRGRIARLASAPPALGKPLAPRGAPVVERLVVERLDAADAARHRDAWVDLMTRALEPNVFLDPDFALPAAQHLGAARRPGFLLVWADDGCGGRVLVGVASLVGGRNPIRPLASAWLHELSALGFPVLDRSRAAPALDALLAWMGGALPRAAGLLVRAVPETGPTADLLRAAAARDGRPLAVIERWNRAVLHRDGERERAGWSALSAKGAKEARRQRRRLAEHGALGYESADAEDALRRAVELFLALEARGWKGEAGTALLARPAQTAFSRAATRLLARRGLCRVESLTLDGIPIAMGIVLTGGDTDSLWKIAYREDLARFSPGVQFVLDFTGRQREGGRSAITDSCAIPDHPMIDRLWRDRLALADMAIAVQPGRSGGFRMAVAVDRHARSARAFVKRALMAWRRRSSGTGTGG